MRDEHLIYTELENDMIKIVPEDGYKMYCKLSRTYLSEAVTIEKQLGYFVSESK